MANPDAEPEHVQQIIRRLGLVPHPEGGYFVETLRSGCEPMISRGKTDTSGECIQTDHAGYGGLRNVCTVIYYLLTRNSPVQCMIRNKSTCIHTFNEGSPLAYYVLKPDGTVARSLLGPASEASSPQFITCPSDIKAARLEDGEYCLLSEVVTPGFCVSDCHMLSMEEVRQMHLQLERWEDLVHEEAVHEDGCESSKKIYGQFYTHLTEAAPDQA